MPATAVRAISPTPFPRGEGGALRWLAAVAVAFLLSGASTAGGHIKPLVGKLVDLVNQSDLVVIGVVAQADSDSADGAFAIVVEQTVFGTHHERLVIAPCPARLSVGRRYVVFLAWEEKHWRCVQPSGTRFPVAKAGDADYARTIKAIQQALRLSEESRIPALRAALIPALRSPTMELRYHAALGLVALTHTGHELSDEERQALLAVRTAPDLDPALKPVLERLVGAQ